MLGLGYEHADDLDHPLDERLSAAPGRTLHARRRRALLVTLVAATLAWVLIGWVIVPATVFPVPAYWSDLARRVLIGWVALAALVWVMTSRLAVRHVGTATPGALGAMRVVVCLALFGTTLGERAATVAGINAWERGGDMGVMHVLYDLPLGLNALAGNGTAMQVLKGLTLALLAAGMVGWRTRVVLPAAAVCWLILAGIVRSYTSFSHNGLVPFYLLVILCFLRSGDGFSVDRLLRLARGQPVVAPDARRAHYAWGRYAIWAAVALFYLSAGLSKIRIGGWMWWDWRNIEAILLSGAFRGFAGDRPILSMTWVPKAAFSAMGLFTLLTELGFVLVLLSWRARLLWPAMALGMHVGIRVVQKIRFYDLMLLQVLFYDWTRVRRWVGERLRRRWGVLAVRLDATDDRAARLAALLRACDLFELLDVAVVTSAPDTAATSALTATRQRDGRQTSGRMALAAIALRVPALWPVAPLLPVPLLGPAVLAVASRLWNRVAPADAAADVRPASLHVPPPRAWRPFGWPVAVPALIVLMVACCVNSVEQFPFTSMRMYARSNRTGIHTYTRLLMTTRDGDVRRVEVGEFGGTVKRHNRPMVSALSDNPEDRNHAIAQLQHWGAAWNRRRRDPGDRGVSLEIQKVRWDFINHRNDPARGQVVERLVIPLDPSRRGALATR